MRALLLALLLPASALAGAGASNAELSPAATSAALTLYVDTAGSDANACTSSGAGACATIQSALNRVPRRLRHPVIIEVGSGNFAGAIIDGFRVEPAGASQESAAPGAGLMVRGTMGAVTPTTGAGTGTITSSATSAPGGHLVITDSGQTWTSSDLRGKFLAATSGAQAGAYYPIIDNTATTATIAFTSTSGFTAGISYGIHTPGTVINSMVPLPTNVASTAASSAAHGFVVIDSGNPTGTGTVDLRQLKLSFAGTGFSIYGSSVNIRNIDFSGITMNTTRYLVTNSDSNVGVQRASAVSSNAAGAANFCVLANTPGFARSFSLSNSHIRGCNAAYGMLTSLIATRIENVQSSLAAVAIFRGGHGGVLQPSGLSIDCGSSSTTGISLGEANGASGSYSIASAGAGLGGGAINNGSGSNDFSNCGQALLVGRGGLLTSGALIAGTGNTIGVAVREGGRYVQHASTTLTGSTADVQIDGVNYTLANVRAAGGKRITDAATGSVVVEP